MPSFTIVVCPDAFKETLSARLVTQIICGSLGGMSHVHLICSPMADGGDGTLDALCPPEHQIAVDVTGPLGRPVEALFGFLPESRTAVIEMARASGLALVPLAERDILRSTTRGTGELILHALDLNPLRIIICVGGSATNDGGAGALQAMGAKLLDAAGHDIAAGGIGLQGIASVNLRGIDNRLLPVEILVAADVTNPLCGASGASWTFGPQKGANAEVCATLDAALLKYGRMLEAETGIRIVDQAGAGAAGGLAAGLLALGAQIAPGFQIVSEAVGLEESVSNADIVITGEGKLDRTSLHGKTVGRVFALCRKYNKPCYVVAGASELEESEFPDALAGVFTTAKSTPPTADDLANAAENLKIASDALASHLLLKYPPDS